MDSFHSKFVTYCPGGVSCSLDLPPPSVLDIRDRTSKLERVGKRPWRGKLEYDNRYSCVAGVPPFHREK